MFCFSRKSNKSCKNRLKVQEKGGFAVFAVAFVFPISITVCRGVAQDLVRRADIAVIVLIINILILPEESILCHWSFVWEQGSDPIIQKKFSNRRRFVACVQDASGYLKKDLSFN